METVITYLTVSGFYDGILELTKRGLTFNADPSRLQITLTGGY